MNRIIYTIAIFCISAVAMAQVGIGTNDPKSTLDVALPPGYTTGTPAGISIPRATAAQIEAMTTTSLPEGTIIWSTTATGTNINGIGYWYWNGSAWTTLSGGGGTADGDGIYSADKTITTARNVTLGNGDLTFNGDNLSEGNDVLIGTNSALRTNGARYKATRVQSGAGLGTQNILANDDVYVLSSTNASDDVNVRLPDPAQNEGRIITLINNAVEGATIELTDIIVGGSPIAISDTNFVGISSGHLIYAGEVYTCMAIEGKWFVKSIRGYDNRLKVAPDWVEQDNYTIPLDYDVVLLDTGVTGEPAENYIFPSCTQALHGRQLTILTKGGSLISFSSTSVLKGEPVAGSNNRGKKIICLNLDGGVGTWQWLDNY